MKRSFIQPSRQRKEHRVVLSLRRLLNRAGARDSRRTARPRAGSPCYKIMATLHVKVVPGASRDRIAGKLGDALKVQVSAAAERGKANAAVIAVIAATLGLR